MKKINIVIIVSSFFVSLLPMEPGHIVNSRSQSSSPLSASSGNEDHLQQSARPASPAQPKSPMKKFASLITRRNSVAQPEKDDDQLARDAYESCTGCNIQDLKKANAKQRPEVILAINQKLKALQDTDPEKYAAIKELSRKNSPDKLPA